MLSGQFCHQCLILHPLTSAHLNFLPLCAVWAKILSKAGKMLLIDLDPASTCDAPVSRNEERLALFIHSLESPRRDTQAKVRWRKMKLHLILSTGTAEKTAANLVTSLKQNTRRRPGNM